MKKNIIVLAAFLLLAKLASADPATLRKGYAQTPEQAKSELDSFKKSYADVRGWEERKKKIREGILEGAKLTKLPEKTPLRPRYFNKRRYKGYTAENVAMLMFGPGNPRPTDAVKPNTPLP